MANAKRTKVTPVSKITIDAYCIIGRAVEEGVKYGWNRAHKHESDPDDDIIKDCIDVAVMDALSEVLSFGDDSEQ